MTAYDAHHPPEKDLINDCVHCGFCLPTCPTYALWGEEMDSPRGRIYLMDLVHDGAATFDDTLVRHFDTCLGCMACVSACPSAVQYDKLIASMRPQIERNYRRSWQDRLFRRAIFMVFPYPRRLRIAAIAGLLYQRTGLNRLFGRRRSDRRRPTRLLGRSRGRSLGRTSGRLGGQLGGRLSAAEALLPPVRFRDLVNRLPEKVPAVGKSRRQVVLLSGCVQRVFFSSVNQATIRVLSAEGCEVLIPRDQGCCGALSEHVGRETEALARARNTIETFDRYDVDDIVVNVAGCGSAMKEYGYLLRDDPDWAARAEAFSAKVKDVTEVLAELGPRATRQPIEATVAYHDACHLGHAQRVREQPRAVLRSIPGLRLVDIPEAEICCGSAGVFNLLEPQAAEELGKRKADNVLSVRPDIIATANPGCLLQIRRYLENEIPLVHPVELLDRSINSQGNA